MVSDNGPQFVSLEFEQFTKENGIKDILIASRHPWSDGQVEHFVATFKTSNEGRKLQQITAKFDPTEVDVFGYLLLRYRSMPSIVTGMTWAELF